MSNRHAWPLILFALLVSASSCSTFSKKECQEMNWGDEGFKAATSGDVAREKLSYFGRECGEEHGVTPDAKVFTAGYETGITSFCSADNGMRFGREGMTYRNTCPQNLEKAFLEKYQLGKIEYASDKIQQLESQVSELQSQNRQKDAEIEELQKKVNPK